MDKPVSIAGVPELRLGVRAFPGAAAAAPRPRPWARMRFSRAGYDRLVRHALGGFMPETVLKLLEPRFTWEDVCEWLMAGLSYSPEFDLVRLYPEEKPKFAREHLEEVVSAFNTARAHTFVIVQDPESGVRTLGPDEAGAALPLRYNGDPGDDDNLRAVFDAAMSRACMKLRAIGTGDLPGVFVPA